MSMYPFDMASALKKNLEQVLILSMKKMYSKITLYR